MDIIPLVLFWGLAILSFSRGPAALIYLLFASMPFGAFAVVSPSLTAGLTLTPSPMLALLFMVRIFATVGGLNFLASLVMKPQRLSLLLAFWVAAGAATIFLPSLFYRQTNVIPLRAISGGGGPSLLEPTPQNISQLAYLTISIFLVFAFAYHFRDRQARGSALGALLVGATVTIATGILDYLSQSLPIALLLEPFRTATYALLTDAELMGVKRIVGLMPEASAFGNLCIAFLSAVYFFRNALLSESPGRAALLPVLIVALASMVWLSTSSAAIVGLIVFATVIVGEWLWRSLTGSRSPYVRKGLAVEFWTMAGLCVALSLMTLAEPASWNPVFEKFDTIILSKGNSSSFEERSMWNAVSIGALLDTYGLGVGLGGTRASNAVVALASNVGIIGAFLYYGFLVSAFLSRAPNSDDVESAIAHGARWSYIAPFATAVLVGTTADFGLFNAWLYGLAIAATGSTSQRQFSLGGDPYGHYSR